MIKIQELIEDIPDGKKRGYLGQLFIKAITDYYDNYGEEELDLNELVTRSFKKLILEDKIINDIKLFASEKLKIICDKSTEIEKLSTKTIRVKLIHYYDIIYNDKFN